MPEPIYHVTALYCGQPRLLFAGYKGRVMRKLNISSHAWGDYVASSPIPWNFGPARDRFGNAMPYTLWSGPVTIAEFVSTTEVVEYEGEAA
jgi:hypothetical protein